MRALQEWVDKILADENYWDQNAFNDLMVRGAIVEPRRKDRLFLCAAVRSASTHPVSAACSVAWQPAS